MFIFSVLILVSLILSFVLLFLLVRIILFFSFSCSLVHLVKFRYVYLNIFFLVLINYKMIWGYLS